MIYLIINKLNQFKVYKMGGSNPYSKIHNCCILLNYNSNKGEQINLKKIKKKRNNIIHKHFHTQIYDKSNDNNPLEKIQRLGSLENEDNYFDEEEYEYYKNVYVSEKIDPKESMIIKLNKVVGKK